MREISTVLGRLLAALRRRWAAETGSAGVFVIGAMTVLLAIGFTGPVQDRFMQELDLGTGERGGAIATKNGGYATHESGMFVAGDAKRGASLIVWAIAEGRKAAREADEYLMGETLLP